MVAIMSTIRIDFADLIEPVARRLLGEPNKQMSRKDELRFGNKGSLAIDLTKGTYFDHEANEGGGVLELIRRDGQSDPVKWLRDERLIPDKPSTNIAAAFDYRDEAGALLFQVCRTADKQFRQRRPNGGGKWIWKLEGVRRVLYRLPELIACAGSTVYIPEGEKHVDRLIGLGINATCNPGGAGKWRAEYNEHLRGADVVVLPDNDDVGREHAIARSLHGTASRVRVLMLPGLKPKGDIINWLEAGHPAEELVRLADEAPDWAPVDDAAPEERAPAQDNAAATTRKSSTVVCAADIVIRPKDWIWKGHLLRGAQELLTGTPGLGKSQVQIGYIACVTAGLAWPDAHDDLANAVAGVVAALSSPSGYDSSLKWVGL